jgi:4-carboxymuconolactone decarboxylase
MTRKATKKRAVKSAGEAMRRRVLGDAHVDAAQARTNPFTAPFQDLITRYPWGEIWTRPGLSLAERSIVTLSILAALGHDEELSMHIVAARRNGLTVTQIREVLLQVAVYAGVPAANRAFKIAEGSLGANDRTAEGRARPGRLEGSRRVKRKARAS